MYFNFFDKIHTGSFNIKKVHKTVIASNMKIIEFANRVDLDEAAHYELPHLDLPCLPSSL